MSPPTTDPANKLKALDRWLERQKEEAMRNLPTDLEVLPSPLLLEQMEREAAQRQRVREGCFVPPPQLRRSPPASVPAAKPSSSSRRRNRRRAGVNSRWSGEEVVSLTADVRAAASKPASSSATAKFPRLTAAPPMPSSVRCSEATPEEPEERLRFFAHQIKSFRKTSFLCFSPEQMQRTKQTEEDYETAVRLFYCRPPSPTPSHMSAAVEQPMSGLQSAAAVEQPTSGLQRAAAAVEKKPASGLQRAAAAVEQPASGIQSAAAAVEQPTSGLQSAAAAVEQPASGLQRAAAAVEQPASGIQSAAAAVEQPTSGLQRAAAAVEQPASGLQNAAAAVEQPMSGLQSAAAVEQPTSGLQRAAAAVEQPASGIQSAAAAVEQPASGIQSAAAAVEQPTSGLQPAVELPEGPECGLFPLPGPEHLLSFLWGVLMELRPDTPQPDSTSSTRRRGRRKRDVSAQVIGGPGDASAPAPSLQAFQGFSEKLVLILASEPCDEGFEEEAPLRPLKVRQALLQSPRVPLALTACL
ncbi:hypothetical protein CRENBAI_003527 [Crenichthys baileyi]|uniref:Uncharacterized protein n=1 Tax=Crenichthys baileyi TaxID=28760 RepID=A0AAV9R3U0_9TELE